MDRLIESMIGAPEWLLVRAVTVESSEGTTVLTPDELEDYAFPLRPFTMRVEISPTRRP